jgi:hypothetical protein
LVVGKARLRYRSLLLTTNLKVALQVESTIFSILSTPFGGGSSPYE